MTLIAFGDIDKYKVSFAPVLGIVRRGSDQRYFFSYWKANSDLFVQLNALFPLKLLKNGKHLSVDFKTNLLRVATCTVKH